MAIITGTPVIMVKIKVRPEPGLDEEQGQGLGSCDQGYQRIWFVWRLSLSPNPYVPVLMISWRLQCPLKELPEWFSGSVIQQVND